MRTFKFWVPLITLLLAVSPAVYAAYPATLQNTVERYDPGKATNEILSELAISPSPPTAHLITIKNMNLAPDDQGNLDFKLHLRQIKLNGNTVFSTERLSRFYRDKIDTDITFGDLKDIAQRITNYYHRAGYVLSEARISAQKVTQDGTATIQIIEGYVNSVSIVGSKNDNVHEIIQAYGYHIARSVPLKYSTLERYAYLANDIPGVKVKVVLVPSQSVDGTADLTFFVEEKCYGAFGEYNNFNSQILGKQQLIGNIHLNNLAMASETAITGIISQDARMHYGSFTHRQQLNSRGLGASILFSNTHTDPDMGRIGFGGYEIPGKAFLWTAGLDYAWIKAHNKSLNVGLGFRFLNSTTSSNGGTFFKDDLRSFNINVLYDFMCDPKTFNIISLVFTQGFDIFFAQGKPPSIPGECITYTKLELYASSEHKFVHPKFSSFLAIKAQYGFNVMPSSETFSYGGVPFGSGYDRTEFSGDRGVAGLAELHYASYANECWKLTSRVYGFLDFGFVWNIYNTFPPSNQSGVSMGVGYKVKALKHLDAAFILGQPLKHPAIESFQNYTRFLFDLKLYV